MNILFIDDDINLHKLIKIANLSRSNLHFNFAKDAQTAFEMIKQEKYEIIICDYMLPYVDGLELIKKLKLEDINIPTIVITSNEYINQKEFFEFGIIDFLYKPLDIEVLFKKLENINNHLSKSFLINDAYTWEPLKFELRENDFIIPLSLNELKIFQTLINNKNKVVNKQTLFEVIGIPYTKSNRIVDVYICNLKNKLDKLKIENCRSVGYVLKS